MVEAYGEVVSLVPAEVEAVWMAMIAIEALFVGIRVRQDPLAAERAVVGRAAVSMAWVNASVSLTVFCSVAGYSRRRSARASPSIWYPNTGLERVK